LGLAGCELDKDSSQLDNKLGQLIKEKIIRAQARVGDTSCLGGAYSSNLDGFDVCGADKTGVAGSELALLSKDEPLVCEPLSYPLLCWWVNQKGRIL
jgi:hypothetical protein